MSASLTKRHFKMIAESICAIESPAGRERQMQHWIPLMRAANPRFDEARFRAYVAQCAHHGSRRRTRGGLFGAFGDLFGSFRRVRRRARGQCSRCGALSGGHFKSCRRR